MKNNTTGIILVGLAAFLLLRQPRNNRPFVPYQSYYPPRPGQMPLSAPQAWANWARTIVNLYGDVRELWEPGGPFHGVPQDQLYEAMNTSSGGIDPTHYA